MKVVKLIFSVFLFNIALFSSCVFSYALEGSKIEKQIKVAYSLNKDIVEQCSTVASMGGTQEELEKIFIKLQCEKLNVTERNFEEILKKFNGSKEAKSCAMCLLAFHSWDKKGRAELSDIITTAKEKYSEPILSELQSNLKTAYTAACLIFQDRPTIKKVTSLTQLEDVGVSIDKKKIKFIRANMTMSTGCIVLKHYALNSNNSITVKGLNPGEGIVYVDGKIILPKFK